MATATGSMRQQGFDAKLPVRPAVLLTGDDVEAKRAEIRDYFHRTFSLYESLFECLASDEAFYVRANSLRHPLIFYYGHTSVFFINKLNVMRLIDARVDARLEAMLAIGVDEMSWDDLDDKSYDWPGVADVKRHRQQTRRIVDRFIATCDLRLPITWDSPLWIILMGIEHERIHLETSSVLIRELPLHLVRQHGFWGRICRATGEAPANELLPVGGGTVRLGKDRSDPLYGWDNEYGRCETVVAPFRASRYLVSNAEFRDFIDAGGYGHQRYWSEEGWRWVAFRAARHPVFWRRTDAGWRYRTMLEEIDLPWDWPVEVNQLEAEAFCNWKAELTGTPLRLPTEAEWMQLRDGLDSDLPDWTDGAPGNIDLQGDMSPCPVTRHACAGGFFDLVGNVWQWTQTPIDGYDGFAVHPAYDDFSTPTFDGKHNLIKGGCWISTGNYAIKRSRYAFRRHFFQHAGLRYVEAKPAPAPSVNVYETDRMVADYIEFHWGEEKFGIANFPVACAQAALSHMQGRLCERALDLGCATGRAAFEFARVFGHVDAVDFSARLIEAPANLQKSGTQRYAVVTEGELVSYRSVTLADFEGYAAAAARIAFMQGDACNLAGKYTDYDLVFAGNLIDRLYDPALFLTLVKSRIRPGGLLVLTSPYTWLEAFTPREKWLGGFKAPTGETYATLDGLRDHLAPEFALLETRDIPFLIRETARKHQYTIAEMSVWEKRG